MKSEYMDGSYTFFLEGRIDSSNVDLMETEIKDKSILFDDMDLAFDME